MIHFPFIISINFLAKSLKVTSDESLQPVLAWLDKNSDLTYKYTPIMNTIWIYPNVGTDLNNFAWDLDEALNTVV